MTPMHRRRFCGLLGGALAVVVTACSGDGEGDADNLQPSDVTNGPEALLSGLSVVVRRDPGCGCCTEWVEYLRSQGATVEVTEDPDRVAFRGDVGVPNKAASCHTAFVDGYAIEGHVPAEAIQRLLTDRPQAAGLALPGMPSDAPGMGGDTATWTRQKVVLIARDGSLTDFMY